MGEHDHIDDLIAQLRDGEPDAVAAQELAGRLRDDPGARERYLRQMYLASLLREAVGEKAEAAQPKRSLRWLYGAAAAAAVLVIGFFVLQPPAEVGLEAVLETKDGTVLIGGQDAAVGATISPGQSLEIRGEAGSAAFVYADGTRVLVTGSAELKFAEEDHKHLIISSGVLHADVAKQPAGMPMKIITANAQLEILGTRFVLSAGREATDLNVSEGRVRMTQKGGESVEVSAGERARFSALYGLELSALRTPSTSWSRDFEDESLSWGAGIPITEGLPIGSTRGMSPVHRQLPYDGNFYFQMGIRDGVDGLCRVTEDTHFHLTFRIGGTEDWFNIFITTIGYNEAGKIEVRKSRFDNANLRRPPAIRKQWHTLTVPMSAFTERVSRGKYGGPPPEPGHIIGTVYLGHPPPAREVQIDSIGFTPDGPGERVIEPVEPIGP